MAAGKKRVDCLRCKHFYITWDERHPKGCRAMGFKSREMPSGVVLKSSGMECLRYEKKEPSPDRV